jgi:hypothetical protein
MSKSFVFPRFDVYSSGDGYYSVESESHPDGEYVLAQDALDREAVLQAQIRTLETQLKDATAQYREAGVWDPDGRKFKTYRVENLDGKAMYIKE